MKGSLSTLKTLLQKDYISLSRSISGKVLKCPSSLMNDFVNKIPECCDVKGLGAWFSWNYVSFQFAYWDRQDFKFRTGNYSFPVMIFGQEALGRWKKRDRYWKYFTDKFLDKYQISPPQSFVSINMQGDWERERKENSEKEFYFNCLADRLFIEFSPACIGCKMYAICSGRN